jgi:hypothetical protein
MQRIKNAYYNQRLMLELATEHEANTCLTLLNAVPTVITTFVVKDLNEKITGVDCMMR